MSGFRLRTTGSCLSSPRPPENSTPRHCASSTTKVMEVRITTHVTNYIVIAPTGATLRHFHAVPSSPRGRETAPRQLTRVTRTSDGFCGWCWHHCSFGVVPPGGASAGGPCSKPPPPSVRDSDAAESFWRASRLQSKGIEAGTLAMMNDVQVDL